jgi:hypothetical protein
MHRLAVHGSAWSSPIGVGAWGAGSSSERQKTLAAAEVKTKERTFSLEQAGERGRDSLHARNVEERETRPCFLAASCPLLSPRAAPLTSRGAGTLLPFVSDLPLSPCHTSPSWICLLASPPPFVLTDQPSNVPIRSLLHDCVF